MSTNTQLKHKICTSSSPYRVTVPMPHIRQSLYSICRCQCFSSHPQTGGKVPNKLPPNSIPSVQIFRLITPQRNIHISLHGRRYIKATYVHVLLHLRPCAFRWFTYHPRRPVCFASVRPHPGPGLYQLQ